MASENLPYALGVDGGSSKTHALVVDVGGRVKGFGQAGPGNHQSRGLQNAIREIDTAVRAALAEANIQPSAVDTGCFCLAGADLPEDYLMLQEAIQVLSVARAVIIKNDTMAALRAGLSRPWGVVVICGTGFNAAGRAPDGREIVLPGLGTISGDWGGGGELSWEMIRMIMRAWDGRGKPTLLTKLVLDALQLPSEEALLAKLYHNEIDHWHLLDLVPLLFEAAEAGDEVARELIVFLGTEVGVTARTLVRRLGLENEDVEIILGGSVFKGKGPLLLETATRVIHEIAPRGQVKRTDHEPVVGATLLALEAMGVTPDEQLQQALASTLPDRLTATRPSPSRSSLRPANGTEI
jgi:N-acetylglucosamine kinase-like BadF-type ATPase